MWVTLRVCAGVRVCAWLYQGVWTHVRVGSTRFIVDGTSMRGYPSAALPRCTFVKESGMKGSDLVGVLTGGGGLTGASTVPKGALLVGRFLVGGG